MILNLCCELDSSMLRPHPSLLSYEVYWQPNLYKPTTFDYIILSHHDILIKLYSYFCDAFSSPLRYCKFITYQVLLKKRIIQVLIDIYFMPFG